MAGRGAGAASQHYDDIYQMKRVRGLVVIFNNNFKGDLLQNGAKKDFSDMEKLWTEFGCKIIKEEDTNKDDMESILDGIAKGKKIYTEGEKFNYLAVFVMWHGELKDDRKKKIVSESDMSHGELKEKNVSGSDHEPISVRDIKHYFRNANSRYWIGIPKLFFFQFCRGTNLDGGYKFDSGDIGSSKQPTHCSYSDMFLSYATLSEFTALRVTPYGSWFIIAIRDMFRKYAETEHLAELMTRVRGEVESKKNNDGTTTECETIGESHDMLRRRLYLRRPSDNSTVKAFTSGKK